MLIAARNSSTTAGTLPSVKDFRVGFYNIYVGLQNGTKYAAIQSHIERITPDIMGLCELSEADKTTITGTLGPATGYTDFAFGGATGVVIGIMSKHTIVSSGTVTSPLGSNEFSRKPLWAIIDIGADANVLIYVIHPTSWCLTAPCNLESRPTLEFARAIEWIRIKDHIEAKRAIDSSLHVIVMGDYNDTDDDTYQTDAFSSRPPGAILPEDDVTYPVQYATYPDYQCEQAGLTALKSTDLDGDRTTLWANTPNAAFPTAIKLDFIANSSNVSVRGHEVLSSEATQVGGLEKYGDALLFADSRDASDHKCIFADLTVPA